MSRARYRFNRTTGGFDTVDEVGDPIPDKTLDFNSTFQFCGIRVISDLEPYISPIDGSVVKSRSDHRDHMKRHDVVEYGTEKLKHRAPVKRSPVGPSIKQAIEKLKQGYRPQVPVSDD